jgi:plastocyanin
MKFCALLFCLAIVLEASVSAGVIRGTVRAQGKPEAAQGSATGKYDSKKYKFLERINYDELRDFVVYIDEPLPEKPGTPARHEQVVTQKDGMFRPHVLPIAVGTQVDWPNHDDIFHNVFSISDIKQFDLGVYKDEKDKKDKSPSVLFDKQGRVDVFCSIHSQMHCIILVVPNPHFAVTDARRNYLINNIPPGTYTVKAWHERLPAQVKKVTVPATGEVTVDFTLTISGLPKS